MQIKLTFVNPAGFLRVDEALTITKELLARNHPICPTGTFGIDCNATRIAILEVSA